MTRNIRKKMIYKDLETGQLIPKKVADARDPATWVAEEFVVVTEQLEDTDGEAEPPLLTESL